MEVGKIFRGALDKTTGLKQIKGGSITPPDIAPGINGNMNLNLPSDWSSYDAYYVTAVDDHNREIFTWTWPIKNADEVASKIVQSTAQTTASGREDADYVYSSANGVEVSLTGQPD